MLWPFSRPKSKYVLTVHDFAPHPGEASFGRRRLMRHELNYADDIISLSQWVRRQISEYGFDGTIWTNPTGPSITAIAAQDGTTRPVGRLIRIMFFGRILAYKGIPMLLQAIEAIHRERGNIELLILGKGDSRPFERKLAEMPYARMENRWVEKTKPRELSVARI